MDETIADVGNVSATVKHNRVEWIAMTCLFADVLLEESEKELLRMVDHFHMVCGKGKL